MIREFNCNFILGRKGLYLGKDACMDCKRYKRELFVDCIISNIHIASNDWSWIWCEDIV